MPAGRAAFRRLLVDHEPQPKPTLVALEVASIDEAWAGSRWKLKLQAAVESADAGFSGPLQDPVEPWYYDFRPEQDRAFAVAACGR